MKRIKNSIFPHACEKRFRKQKIIDRVDLANLSFFCFSFVLSSIICPMCGFSIFSAVMMSTNEFVPLDSFLNYLFMRSANFTHGND